MRSKKSHDPSIQKTLNVTISCLLHFSLPIITTEIIASFQRFIMHLPLFPQCQACILLVLLCSLLPLQLNLTMYYTIQTYSSFLDKPNPKQQLGVVQTFHQEAGCVDNTHSRVGADVIFILTRL